MATFYKENKEVFTSKPTQAVEIDWSHPISQKLHAVYGFGKRDLTGTYGDLTLNGGAEIVGGSIRTYTDGDFFTVPDIWQSNPGTYAMFVGEFDDIQYGNAGFAKDDSDGRDFFAQGGYSFTPYIKYGNATQTLTGENGGKYTQSGANLIQVTRLDQGGDINIWANGKRIAYGTSTRSDDFRFTGIGKNGNAELTGRYDLFVIFKEPLTDAEAALITANPYAFLKPAAPQYIPIGAGGATPIAIDTASEVDSAVELASVTATAIDTASETDSATALTGYKQGSIDVSAETDTAVELESVTVTVIDTASETDSATNLSGSKRSAISASADISTANNLTGYKQSSISTSSEVDTATELSGYKQASLETASEVDSAPNLVLIGGALPIDLASELDNGINLTGIKRGSIDTSTQVDSAIDLSGTKRSSISASAEIDSGVELVLLGGATPISVADELDNGIDLTGIKRGSIDAAAEAGSATELAGSKRGLIDVGAEVDTAVELALLSSSYIGVATETDSGINLMVPAHGIIRETIIASMDNAMLTANIDNTLSIEIQ